MNSSRKSLIDLSGYDWIAVLLCLLLMATGWTMIFASEYNPDTFSGLLNLDKNYGKQLIWIAAGILLFVFIQFIEGRIFQNLAFVILGVVLVLLIAVLFTKPINGSTSWFDIGGFRFQPSEFGKTATALALASLLSLPDVRMQSFTGKAQAFVVIGLPLLLVLIQNDTGSTLVYLSFLLVLFRAGLPSGVFIIGLILIALSIAALMVDKIWGIFHILLIIGNFTLLRFWKKDERLSMGFSVLALLSLYFSGTQMFLTIALQLGLLVLVSALNLLK
jgi:rod shape determining protein RodA